MSEFRKSILQPLGLVPLSRLRSVAIAVAVVLFIPRHGSAQLVPGSMDVQWDEGASNCAGNVQSPLQVHPYNSGTFILRESPCRTWEAPFMYLLIGSRKALLIDTGAVADPNQMPLAKTVTDLLPNVGPEQLPLLVVHTHRHLDHRAGDGQFAHFTHVEVVGFDINGVRHYYRFTNWPEGLAQIDLGARRIDVIPTPGHSETEVSFYDRQTGLFFSGDFLMPGRLLIEDATAYLASAERVAAFVRNRPLSFVLGGHIELNSRGETFPWESQYHPNEHVLQMTKDDLLALPVAIRKFNGFYARDGEFIMMNSVHILVFFGVLSVGAILSVTLLLIRHVRRRKRSRDLEH